MLFNQHPLPPIFQDQYKLWLDDPVTQHFLRDLENMYMDSMLDPLPTTSIDKIAIIAIKRDAYRELSDKLFDWSPIGIDKEVE